MWFVLWLVFVVFLLLVPLAYGWGYRQWGPPRPGTRRRAPKASGKVAGAPDVEVEERHEPEPTGWGLLAAAVWVAALVAVVWLVVLVFI